MINVHIQVNGQWSPWKKTGTCSENCYANHKRTCDQQVPKYGGDDCEGISESSFPCATEDCYRR